MNESTPFLDFVKRLTDALSATPGTGDESNSSWRAFLTLPDGKRLFVRTGKKGKVDIHPLIGGKVQSDFIGAAEGTVNLKLTVSRIAELFSETGEWGKMHKQFDEEQKREGLYALKRAQVMGELKEKGWTIFKSGTCYFETGTRTLQILIDHYGSITLQPMGLTLSELDVVATAFSEKKD